MDYDVFDVLRDFFNNTISTGQLGAIAFGVVMTVATFVKTKGALLISLGAGMCAALVGFVVGNLDFMQQLVDNTVRQDAMAVVVEVPAPAPLPPLPGTSA